MENESNINLINNQAEQKPSQKQIDIFCREILQNNHELKTEIQRCMHILNENNVYMPIIHITSDAIQTQTNKINTGFIENIMKSGFKQKDTNVAVFLEGSGGAAFTNPEYFENNPEEFIKNIKLFIKRYVHHGLRVNKDSLKELKNNGVGIPKMIIIEGNVELQHGSDYDNHYILEETVPPEKIIGNIDLSEHNRSASSKDIEYIAKEFVKLLHSYYTKER